MRGIVLSFGSFIVSPKLESNDLPDRTEELKFDRLLLQLCVDEQINSNRMKGSELNSLWQHNFLNRYFSLLFYHNWWLDSIIHTMKTFQFKKKTCSINHVVYTILDIRYYVPFFQLLAEVSGCKFKKNREETNRWQHFSQIS